MEGWFIQLDDLIARRVHQLRKRAEAENLPPYTAQMKEDVAHMNRILALLPEKERKWLDDRLADRIGLEEKESERLYRQGMSDAMSVLQHLKGE